MEHPSDWNETYYIKAPTAYQTMPAAELDELPASVDQDDRGSGTRRSLFSNPAFRHREGIEQPIKILRI